MKRKQSFIKGAAILGIAALFTKLLGAVYRIPYQNITGDEGMFVYQQVYPLYSLLLTVATAGVPIAISKMVSERLAQSNPIGARRLFWTAATVLTTTGVIFFILLFFSAPWIADWMGSQEMLTLPIRAVAFSLLIVPLTSTIRGYFQGYQDMVPTAVSQVAEQLVRVGTILFAAWWMMSIGVGVVLAGTGAVFGAFTGALAALIALLFFWQRRLKGEKGFQETVVKEESVGEMMKRLFALAIPICFGSLVLPLFSLIDSFTVANVLEWSGWTKALSIQEKGVYDRSQPMIQFASFFASAVSLSIVPAIAEAQAQGKLQTVVDRSGQAINMTLLLGLPASIGLAIVAAPTNIMLFKNDAGSAAMSIFAFTTIFSTLGMTSSGILQGLGYVMLPARNLMIGALTKLGLNLLLIPIWDIRGAAMATVIGYGVATVFNLWAITSKFPGMWQRIRFGRLFVANIWMGVAAYGVMWLLIQLTQELDSLRLAMTITSLSAVVVGVIVYTYAVFRFGVLKRKDVERIPKLKRLLPLLDSLRLFGKEEHHHKESN